MAANKITPGTPVAAGPIRSAAFQNALVDIVDWWRKQGLGRGRDTQPGSRPTDVIKVKNITGSDRQAGQVLEVDTHLLAEVDKRRAWFNADSITHATGRTYCVLDRPIPAGEIDDAHVAGWCVAKVDVQDTGDRFAYVEVGSRNLKSTSVAAIGQFRLLGPLTGTGVQDLYVLFDYAPVPSYFHAAEGGFGTVAGTMLDCTWGLTPDVSGDFSWSDPELTWNGAEGAKATLDLNCRMAPSGTPTGSEWFTVAMVSDYPSGYPSSLGDEHIVFAVKNGDTTLLQPLAYHQRYILHHGAKYKLKAQRILGSAGTTTMYTTRVFWSLNVHG